MNTFLILLLFFLDFILLLIFWLVNVVLGLFRKRPNQYWSSVYIEAPITDVWDVATARDITLDGWPALTLQSRDIPDVPDAFQVEFEMLGEPLAMGFRTIERREGEAVLYEVLPGHTSPKLIKGTEHYVAFLVEAQRSGTRLKATFRLYDNSVWNRVVIPFELRWQLRRIKRHVERRAGGAGPS